jgi:hypothetical protein
MKHQWEQSILDVVILASTAKSTAVEHDVNATLDELDHVQTQNSTSRSFAPSRLYNLVPPT